MYGSLVPFVREDSLLPLFDLLEDRAFEIVGTYLGNHKWTDEHKRLAESRFTGVGVYRLLTNTSIECLDDSVEDLIRFYERCKRPKDDPHYEDLIVTLLMGIVVGILANFCYDEIKAGARETKKLCRAIWKKFGGGIGYVLTARWAREMLWEKRISTSDHILLVGTLRAKYLTRVTLGQNESRLLSRAEIQLDFQSKAKRHDLAIEDLESSLLLMLMELASNSAESTDVLERFAKLLREHERGNYG